MLDMKMHTLQLVVRVGNDPTYSAFSARRYIPLSYRTKVNLRTQVPRYWGDRRDSNSQFACDHNAVCLANSTTIAMTNLRRQVPPWMGMVDLNHRLLVQSETY